MIVVVVQPSIQSCEFVSTTSSSGMYIYQIHMKHVKPSYQYSSIQISHRTTYFIKSKSNSASTPAHVTYDITRLCYQLRCKPSSQARPNCPHSSLYPTLLS